VPEQRCLCTWEYCFRTFV